MQRHSLLRLRLRRAATALAFVAASGAVPAQPAPATDWPKGPVRIVVPYGPGSTPDIIARIVGDKLAKRTGQPMIVDNKAGASGNLGTDAIAKAAADGSTIGVSIAGPLGVNALLFKKMPYDAKDLELVSIAATQPSVLVVPATLGVATTDELVALMKKNPGKYNYASMGAGSISHLAMESLASKSGTSVVHVPYAGSGPAVTALLSGNADIAVLPAAAVMPQIKAGKIKALAVATAKRSAALPELPTLAEAGLKDIQADAWMGFVVPAKTPDAIVRRLHAELVAILADPEVREKLKLQYMDVVADTPAEARAVLAADVERWRPIIQKNNITLD
ncbi:MAG TPA: tripartite tricarboxylate transporter substrate binding protein [Caldimonas sp.]|jgi:tripartite-type tricarboxylate transporter receptor subunit TctC|nr:tripartite tricarboxylate transporter substrate binding protein [Caldimonas sp.]